MEMKQIDSKTAIAFLLPRHYSGRIPPISKAYGWLDGDELKAVCTFGKPASAPLCKGICGGGTLMQYMNLIDYAEQKICKSHFHNLLAGA